jgi:methionyl-tRNA formyltransferase
LTQSVAVAATAPFGADVLERVAASHDVSSLLTRPDAPAGRGRKVAPPPAKAAAERLGIPVLQPERLVPGIDLGAPTVVAVAYGLIVPDDVLAERLWLNVHPSLLPRWRGAAPIERALMAGDAETGVTVIRLVKELDAGPIAAQRAFPIAPDDDAGGVYARAAELAAELLDGVLDDPTFADQPSEGATYAEKITAEDRRLDLDLPAAALVDVVRALSPHIGARSRLHDRDVTVWRARVGDDGSFEPLEVQPDGGRRMAYEAWLRGLRP